MSTAPEQDWFNRLPKRAQLEISSLRSENRNLKRRLAIGPEESNAFLSPFSETPTPLGKDPVIKFWTGGDEIDGFTVQFKDGELLVQGMAPHYDDYLVVRPMSGNYVAIGHMKKGS